MALPLPPFVQIGPYRYTVSDAQADLDRQRVDMRDTGCTGVSDHTTTQIVLDPKTSRPYQRDTLLHEILHGVYHATGAKVVKLTTEEQVISHVCTVLLDTLRRNPETVAFLLEEDGPCLR